MWLAETNGNSKQKKGEASCTCSDPRGSSTMVKQGAADASQKPIDPSSLSITEALAGTFVATVFEFVQLKTVTPKVLNDAVGLMYEHAQGHADTAMDRHQVIHQQQQIRHSTVGAGDVRCYSARHAEAKRHSCDTLPCWTRSGATDGP